MYDTTSPLASVLRQLPDAKRHGNRYAAKCPVHQGAHRDSLSITEGNDGRILLYCFGGCEASTIVQALGLTWSDLFATPLPHRRQPTTTKRTRRRVIVDPEGLRRLIRLKVTASTLYAALYVGAILRNDLPSLPLSEHMGCYVGLCEDLGRVYVDQGYEAMRSTWDAWQPELRRLAPGLLDMLERGVC